VEVVCRLTGVVKDYPGQRALDLDSLEIGRGEIHALVGQNGAGKSTLVKVLSGAEHPTRGRIELNGAEVRFASPADARRHGIAPVFQEMAMVPRLSGVENANLGLRYPRWGPFVRWHALQRRTREAAERLGITPADLRRPASELSVAQLQMIAICRGLLQDARLLLLDEPTASLTETEVQRLYEVIGDLTAHGVSVLYISHRLDEVEEIADRITVLRDGRRIATLDSGATRGDVVGLITGGDTYPETARHSETQRSEVVLEARELEPVAGRAVSFSLHRGEILGLAGLVGSGRTTLARTLSGARKTTGGAMLLSGGIVRPESPRAAIQHGIVLVPEDRRREALFLRQSVAFNVSLASLGRLSRFRFWLSRRAERRSVTEFIRRLAIRTRSPEQPVWQLSGGNQQKTVLARWMMRGAQVFVVDEPTVGLDVGARAEVHGVLRHLADEGAGVLFISSDLDELAMVVDRALVLRRGRVVAELRGEQLTKAQMLRHCYEVSASA
jgi:ribose transport system ATP-binding protein